MIRNILSNNIYHVYNRGTEKRRIFYNQRDYNYFLSRMFFYKDQFKVKILSYAILPNHFHFLLEEPTSDVVNVRRCSYKPNTNQYHGSKISKFISILLNSYTKYFNNRREHSGRIFQGPFKSKLISSDTYLQTVFVYVNLNPIKHGVVNNINDWLYTSHHYFSDKFNSGIVDSNDFIDKTIYKSIIKNYKDKIENNDVDLEFD
ncbi:MAG: hypothetical protein PHZ07_02555 [Patescibacteria group bacterium]|nr:hypothetical protein [Patescibacteria group bacterium]MDD4304280.1 hypothetical protein [Patescibacteria group bacterium]MDD4695334.1 hypothetical protein [Patescibacteria group bacterium]